ncbi:hypothetical protein V1477_017859 [Vespula maculifrons]|uniref:Uncharacterized protein n=1 Tax=Vespula maculifrons TaxID=7453 RepID=A0ABD2B002_VESMC
MFFSLFPLNRYNSAPIGPIRTKKIWAKCFFPLNPLNRYNSAPIGPIWTKKIWAYRSRRALSNDPGPGLLCATVSEKKIVKKMFLSFVPFKPL